MKARSIIACVLVVASTLSGCNALPHASADVNALADAAVVCDLREGFAFAVIPVLESKLQEGAVLAEGSGVFGVRFETGKTDTVWDCSIDIANMQGTLWIPNFTEPFDPTFTDVYSPPDLPWGRNLSSVERVIAAELTRSCHMSSPQSVTYDGNCIVITGIFEYIKDYRPTTAEIYIKYADGSFFKRRVDVKYNDDGS